MSEKLTFKQYLQLSKDQLCEALTKVPEQHCRYTVSTYCKLPIGDDKDDKEYIQLKPKQIISVNWLYENVNTPTIKFIRFEGIKGVDSEEQYSTFWQGTKLVKWLERNTKQLT